MTSAVSIGRVVLGDKKQLHLTDTINSGHAVDLAELEGDDETGADVCQEYKVPSPLTATHRAGRGSLEHGGSPANVGHRYALGSTEERYRLDVLGCKGRGRLGRDKPLNHKTGKGTVKERRGQYFDALRNKRSTVIPMIVETFGGISPHAIHHIAKLAKRAKHGRDGTAYGRSRTSPKTFFVHHTQQLALAAILGDAKAIRRETTIEKTRLAKGLRGSTAGGRA